MDQPTVDSLIMDPTVVGAEARSILNNSEDHAHLIERTAKAIEHARIRMVIPDRWLNFGVDSPEFDHHWNVEMNARGRITARQQARAALGASELLKRIEELENQIDAARRECVIYGGELNGQSLARKVNRVDRILSKPVPDPEPIGVKRKP
jgi:hypothetical protein